MARSLLYPWYCSPISTKDIKDDSPPELEQKTKISIPWQIVLSNPMMRG